MTDAARFISQNTAGTVENGIYIPQKFSELFERDDEPEEEDPRSCVEIVADMWRQVKGGTNDG